MEKLSPAQRKASTAAGRAAFEARFDAEVDAMDPQRKMSADERARRIREARSAYFSRIATKRQSS